MNIIFCQLKEDNSSIAINVEHIVAVIQDNFNTRIITVNEIFDVRESQFDIIGNMRAA
jgi:hypothetical protein